MKKILKTYGLIGGTAAACVACCAAPLAMGPLLAWLGASALGLVFSPWFLLLLAVPALLMLARRMSKRTPQPDAPAAGGCGCSTTPASGERKNRAADKPAPIACTPSCIQTRPRTSEPPGDGTIA